MDRCRVEATPKRLTECVIILRELFWSLRKGALCLGKTTIKAISTTITRLQRMYEKDMLGLTGSEERIIMPWFYRYIFDDLVKNKKRL